MTNPRDEQRDQFTGLHNRRYTMAALQQMVESVDFSFAPDDSVVGVILADIFRLKQPHDAYGHSPIDEVIQAVANIVQQQARPDEIACRYGGDEFLLVVPRTGLEELQQRAEKLRQVANALHIYLDGQPRETIHLSVGAAIWPPVYRWIPRPTTLWGVEALMQAADQDLQNNRNIYLREEER